MHKINVLFQVQLPVISTPEKLIYGQDLVSVNIIQGFCMDSNYEIDHSLHLTLFGANSIVSYSSKIIFINNFIIFKNLRLILYAFSYFISILIKFET